MAINVGVGDVLNVHSTKLTWRQRDFYPSGALETKQHINMRPFKVTSTLKRLHNKEVITVTETFILGSGDDLSEHLEMCYGSWYDIVSFESEPLSPNSIHISKTYLIEKAKEMITFT
jgi:hypothetical protein